MNSVTMTNIQLLAAVLMLAVCVVASAPAETTSKPSESTSKSDARTVKPSESENHPLSFEEAVIKMHDKNKDGKASVDEVMPNMLKMIKMLFEHKAIKKMLTEEQIKSFDLNKNGFFEKDEIFKSHDGMMKLMGIDPTEGKKVSKEDKKKPK